MSAANEYDLSFPVVVITSGAIQFTIPVRVCVDVVCVAPLIEDSPKSDSFATTAVVRSDSF